MSKFATKQIEAVDDGVQKIRQLVILDEKEVLDENTQGVLDLYENSLQVRNQSSFRNILTIMRRIAKNESVAEGKFKDVTPKGVLIKEYEFKCNDLRVYAIKIPNGQLVLLAGYKNEQKANFRKFRSLKNIYLESIKEEENEKKRIIKK